MESGVKKNYCDTINYPVAYPFDATKYMGKWYEQQHTKTVETF